MIQFETAELSADQAAALSAAFYRFLDDQQPPDDGQAYLGSVPTGLGQVFLVRLWSAMAMDAFLGELRQTVPASLNEARAAA